MLGTIDPAKFGTLIEVGALINSNYADATSLLTRILESATRLVDGEAASLVLFDESSAKLRFAIALGPKRAELTGATVESGEGIVGWAHKHGRSLIVNDTGSDERFSPDISRSIGFPAHSILAVPMKVREKVVGVIEVVNKRGKKYFTEDDLQWLEIFAVQSAIAVENARYFEKARDEISFLRTQVTEGKGWHELVSVSRAIGEKLDLVDRIAPTDASVLILGESGVGKELFAERLHRKSRRAEGPFVRVNCAALPETLLESELFGHVRGAFTDAVQDRKGRFETADKGTIFLDEIGEIPLRLQSKLLRVLQQKSFEKVGCSESTCVDVRVIAASNRDLEALVEKQEFRADLYYRLNVMPLHIPPLRERPEDIPVLAEHFLRRFCHETNKRISGFSEAASRLMQSYAWPGNVRELENAVERAVVMASGDLIGAQDLMVGSKAADVEEFRGKTLKDALNVFKKNFLRKALEANRWNQTETSKQLDIQRTYLSRLVKELDIAHPKE
ncbi:MAG: sigma 54-interacting transcriptional regulator [Rectinemataceae bacterium]